MRLKRQSVERSTGRLKPVRMVIHKFTASSYPGEKTFESGRIMKVIRWDTQNGLPVFWGVVDEEGKKWEYKVRTYYTGDHPEIGDYDRIGTTIHENGSIILHHVLTTDK